MKERDMRVYRQPKYTIPKPKPYEGCFAMLKDGSITGLIVETHEEEYRFISKEGIEFTNDGKSSLGADKDILRVYKQPNYGEAMKPWHFRHQIGAFA